MLLQRVAQGASAFSSAQALYAATVGGARCFGIDRLYGSIEEGERASLTLVDTHGRRARAALRRPTIECAAEHRQLRGGG